MNRYCTVIGPWFDLFDFRRRFSLEVPHLALQNRLLLLSAMACAARQHHLTSAQPVKTALTYYDEALQLLGVSLKDFSRSSSAAVFASCLLLAHCEMIGASTRDWHLHLSGALSLVTTHGWHRCTAGLGQACLWYATVGPRFSTIRSVNIYVGFTIEWNSFLPCNRREYQASDKFLGYC